MERVISNNCRVPITVTPYRRRTSPRQPCRPCHRTHRPRITRPSGYSRAHHNQGFLSLASRAVTLPPDRRTRPWGPTLSARPVLLPVGKSLKHKSSSLIRSLPDRLIILILIMLLHLSRVLTIFRYSHLEHSFVKIKKIFLKTMVL